MVLEVILKDIELWLGDCLELMNRIPDKSIDLILADLPYGTTYCKWDVIIPFESLWKQYKRIRKDRTPIVLFGTEPFSSYLRLSNIKEYKFDWKWNKISKKGHLVAKKRPLQQTEDVVVFGNGGYNYYPQMLPREKPMKMKEGSKTVIMGGNGESSAYRTIRNDFYPSNLIIFPTGADRSKVHPTQKPVELLEYLIKTYTLEGELVLDNTMGSGSTMVACKNTNRRGVGIEKEKKYYDIAVNRINS